MIMSGSGTMEADDEVEPGFENRPLSYLMGNKTACSEPLEIDQNRWLVCEVCRKPMTLVLSHILS
jgi:hypothetical protein